MIKTPRFSRLGIGLAVGLAAASAAWAERPQPAQQHNSNAVWFENWRGLSNATLKVVAPDGAMTEIFAQKGTPVFKLEGKDVKDGVYRYELSAATEETRKIVNQTNTGRGENTRDEVAVPYHAGGQFVVSRGVIITPEEIKEE